MVKAKKKQDLPEDPVSTDPPEDFPTEHPSTDPVEDPVTTDPVEDPVTTDPVEEEDPKDSPIPLHVLNKLARDGYNHLKEEASK